MTDSQRNGNLTAKKENREKDMATRLGKSFYLSVSPHLISTIASLDPAWQKEGLSCDPENPESPKSLQEFGPPQIYSSCTTPRLTPLDNLWGRF